MAAPQTSSRLQLLQARFQQKQLQEKEQKLLQLYDQQQQRAHQVAQRGSAGSNGSNGSSHGSTLANPTGKVRQMFDERRQNNAKGIDKSYPLEPLKKQSSVNGRKNTLAKRNSKTELYSGANSSSSNRTTVSTQRENVSRESYASSRTFSKDSNGQRENLSRESYASSRGESRQVETDSQFNGQANNGHRYEINIDEVIDNEAMERNRMLAKFNAVEIEKRRRFVDEFPEDLPADESIARKSSQAEARGERLKNASVKKGHATPPAQPASTRKRAESEIPSSPRRSGELNLKKSPPSGKASESTTKADVTVYPSSKSPDSTREQKNRATTKSSSLKFLNQIVGSNEAAETENGFSSVDTQDSDASAFLENKSFEDEKPLGTAPRTASSLSSSSSVGTTRLQGAGNPRQPVSHRAKSNVTPTPAQRSVLPAKNNNMIDESLTTCKICNRRFATERIALHEQICAKTSQKKRKQFDTVTQRVRGTELEPFVAKPVGSKKQTKSNAAAPKVEAPKSNWRRKHEDFINAIRSAKQMQAHLAAGGKLSDLPPPPPSDTSDYIQCPHCSRKFNQTAAERHIPKCETMQHNKPRAQPRSIKR